MTPSNEGDPMGFSDDVGVAGRVHIQVRDPEGRVVQELHAKNLVTLAGRQAIGECLLGQKRPTGALYMVAGTGTRPTALSDTALEAEVAKAVASPAASYAKVDSGVQRIFVPVSATFAAPTEETVQALTEAGILMTLSDGSTLLFNRVTFPAINRQAGLEIALTWEILF